MNKYEAIMFIFLQENGNYGGDTMLTQNQVTASMFGAALLINTEIDPSLGPEPAIVGNAAQVWEFAEKNQTYPATGTELIPNHQF